MEVASSHAFANAAARARFPPPLHLPVRAAPTVCADAGRSEAIPQCLRHIAVVGNSAFDPNPPLAFFESTGRCTLVAAVH